MNFKRKNSYPEGGYCVFSSKTHSYSLTDFKDIKLVSVTRFIDKFFPKFDAAKVAKKVVARRGGNEKELRAKWSKIGKDASAKGTQTHLVADSLLKGDKTYIDHPKAKLIQDHIAKFIRNLGGAFTYSEFIIADKDIGIAGTIDLLFQKRIVEGIEDKIIIADWKDIKEIKYENRWEKCKHPLEEFDACNYIKYSLQLNIYKYILQRKYFLDHKYEMYLFHVKDDKIETIEVDDMESHVKDMIDV